MTSLPVFCQPTLSGVCQASSGPTSRPCPLKHCLADVAFHFLLLDKPSFRPPALPDQWNIEFGDFQRQREGFQHRTCQTILWQKTWVNKFFVFFANLVLKSGKWGVIMSSPAFMPKRSLKMHFLIILEETIFPSTDPWVHLAEVKALLSDVDSVFLKEISWPLFFNVPPPHLWDQICAHCQPRHVNNVLMSLLLTE